jgi:hypothetical protein
MMFLLFVMLFPVKGSLFFNFLLTFPFIFPPRRPYDRHIALNRLKEAGAILTTSESVVFDLMRDAKHPNFKQVSNLIKKQKEIAESHLFAEKTTL